MKPVPSLAYFRPRGTFKSRSGLALVVGLLLLSGCSNDGPTSTAHEAASAPAEAKPAAPRMSRPQVPIQPAQVLRAWEREGRLLQITGESGAYAPLTHACKTCDEFVSEVNQIYASGGWIKVAPRHVVTIRHVSSYGGNRREYVMTLRTGTTTLKRSKGAKTEILDGRTRERFRMYMMRLGNAWKVSDYALYAR